VTHLKRQKLISSTQIREYNTQFLLFPRNELHKFVIYWGLCSVTRLNQSLLMDLHTLDDFVAECQKGNRGTASCAAEPYNKYRACVMKVCASCHGWHHRLYYLSIASTTAAAFYLQIFPSHGVCSRCCSWLNGMAVAMDSSFKRLQYYYYVTGKLVYLNSVCEAERGSSRI